MICYSCGCHISDSELSEFCPKCGKYTGVRRYTSEPISSPVNPIPNAKTAPQQSASSVNPVELEKMMNSIKRSIADLQSETGFLHRQLSRLKKLPFIVCGALLLFCILILIVFGLNNRRVTGSLDRLESDMGEIKSLEKERSSRESDVPNQFLFEEKEASENEPFGFNEQESKPKGDYLPTEPCTPAPEASSEPSRSEITMDDSDMPATEKREKVR